MHFLIPETLVGWVAAFFVATLILFGIAAFVQAIGTTVWKALNALIAFLVGLVLANLWWASVDYGAHLSTQHEGAWEPIGAFIVFVGVLTTIAAFFLFTPKANWWQKMIVAVVAATTWWVMYYLVLPAIGPYVVEAILNWALVMALVGFILYRVAKTEAAWWKKILGLVAIAVAVYTIVVWITPVLESAASTPYVVAIVTAGGTYWTLARPEWIGNTTAPMLATATVPAVIAGSATYKALSTPPKRLSKSERDKREHLEGQRRSAALTATALLFVGTIALGAIIFTFQVLWLFVLMADQSGLINLGAL